jgi:ankyrin repeat protein
MSFVKQRKKRKQSKMSNSGLEEYLLNAAMKGNYEKIEELLMQNNNGIVNVNCRNREEETPLHLACEYEHLRVVQLLLTHGADVNSKNRCLYAATPLHRSCLQDRVDIAELLLDNGAHMNSLNGRGDTPLQLACAGERVDVVEFLLNKGANVNFVKHWERNTPLHISSWFGRVATAELLINKGANVNSKNNSNDTPLNLAVHKGRVATVELLLNHGAIVSSKYVLGPPVYYGRDNDYGSIINLIEGKRLEYRCQAYSWIRWYKGWKI